MIQFARAVSLEVSLASSMMPEDLKAKLGDGKIGDVEKVSRRSLFPGRAKTMVFESVATCSVYSLPTINESVEKGQVSDVGS